MTFPQLPDEYIEEFIRSLSMPATPNNIGLTAQQFQPIYTETSGVHDGQVYVEPDYLDHSVLPEPRNVPNYETAPSTLQDQVALNYDQGGGFQNETIVASHGYQMEKTKHAFTHFDNSGDQNMKFTTENGNKICKLGNQKSPASIGDFESVPLPGQQIPLATFIPPHPQCEQTESMRTVNGGKPGMLTSNEHNSSNATHNVSPETEILLPNIDFESCSIPWDEERQACFSVPFGQSIEQEQTPQPATISVKRLEPLSTEDRLNFQSNNEATIAMQLMPSSFVGFPTGKSIQGQPPQSCIQIAQNYFVDQISHQQTKFGTPKFETFQNSSANVIDQGMVMSGDGGQYYDSLQNFPSAFQMEQDLEDPLLILNPQTSTERTMKQRGPGSKRKTSNNVKNAVITQNGIKSKLGKNTTKKQVRSKPLSGDQKSPNARACAKLRVKKQAQWEIMEKKVELYESLVRELSVSAQVPESVRLRVNEYRNKIDSLKWEERFEQLMEENNYQEV